MNTFIVLIGIGGLLICEFAVSQVKLLITGVEDMYLTKISEPILVKAYKDIGIEVEIKLAPAERALNEVDHGRIDGDIIRKAGLENKYPNLSRIPIVLVIADWVVFTREINISVQGWHSLAPYSIAIQRGLKVAEDGTKGMNVIALSSISQQFKMLSANRVELAVATRLEGILTIKKEKLSGITVLQPSLQKIPLYHYLNKKHKNIITKLTHQLDEMSKTGELAAIKKHAINELLKVGAKGTE